MTEIIPAILTNDVKELLELIAKAEGGEKVQIDIIDGVFASNRTIEPVVLEEVETDLKLDFHLMVKEPINWLEKCVRAGANRVVGQIEMMASQTQFVGRAQEAGLKVGLALDIDTPVSFLETAILNDLDVVLVMSVKAGFGGQKFDAKAMPKIKELARIRSRDKTPFKICVDGGLTPGTIKRVTRIGADEVVMGRRILK